MPEINEIPNPNENNDNLLESLLENQDTKATETNQTLEQILENQDERITETNQLLENQLEMQDKTHDAIKELKPAMNAAGFIQNFMEAIKGDKGDKGDTPEKGKDYYTPEEIAEVVKQITDDIRIPEDGKTPEKGTDYFTEEEIKAVVNDVLSQIPVPSDGIDGKNGKDGLDGDDVIQQGFSDYRYHEINASNINVNAIKIITGAGAGKILVSDADGDATWVTPLAGTKVYYVSDSSGGTVNRKLTFTNGILTAET